jgi:hypothetical protein
MIDPGKQAVNRQKDDRTDHSTPVIVGSSDGRGMG